MRGTKRIAVERGSGNVYADIGKPDAELQLLKAGLVSQIEATIRQRRLTQSQAALALELSQPDVSRLLRGDFREYSIERLLRLLMILGRDIEILVRTTKAQRRGRLSIEAA